MKNIAALIVLLVLVGGVLYGTLGKKNEENHVQTAPPATEASKTAPSAKTDVSSSNEGTNKNERPDNEKEGLPAKIKVGVREGNLAPDFTLDTLDGKSLRLSDLRGKTVIVNLWATWCPPCREEIPDMVAFYEDAKKEGVEILAVNLTSTESSVPNVKRFAEGMNMQFPILLDRKSKVADMYEVTVVPTSFIIGKNGVIRKVVIGPMTKDNMQKMIKDIQ